MAQSALPPAKVNYQVAVRDVHSPLQFVADTTFIVLLSMACSAAFHTMVHGKVGSIADAINTGVVVALFFAAVCRLSAGQRVIKLTNTLDRIKNVGWSWSIAFAGLVFILFALKEGGSYSRGSVITFFLVGLPSVALWRVFTPVALAPVTRKIGSASRACIVVGDETDPLLDQLADEFQADRRVSPIVLRFRGACPVSMWPKEVRHLLTRTADAARELGPGEIYIYAGAIASDRLSAVRRALSAVPRAIFVVPDAQIAALVRCRPAAIGDRIALEVRREPLGWLQRAVKRGLDLLASASALIVLAPFFAVIAVLIKCETRGPVFFLQTRNGYKGKPFKIIKFRSMRVLEDGPVIQQARRDDPRVTRFGKILRKTSIDELPQLVNIFLGQMSLVGPRPHAQAHDELYARSIENYEIRQHVKPGLTGWAQVNGLRGETATLEAMYRRIEFDLWYAVNASVLLDIEILARTVIEVCRRRNAY